MKKLKRVLVVVCITVIATAAATAEAELNEEFASFGISSIGVYSEGYADERVDDFEATYLEAYMMQYVNTFRYTLCDYNAVTPKLMTTNYPLGEETVSADIDALVSEGVAFAAEQMNWKTGIIDDFAGESLVDLRAKAEADGYDAVLVTRYYKVDYFIPFSGYSSVTTGGYSYSTTTTRAKVGKLQSGLALLPAMELYDVKTGVRLWYSANWSGSTGKDAMDKYDYHLKNVEDFFIEESTVGAGNTLETEAVANMVSMTLAAGDFPEASASGSRDEAAVAAQSASPHLFWTDYPEYKSFGTLIGIGYSIGYMGDYDIYYRDSDLNDYDDDGNEIPYALVGTAEHNLMHTMTIPMFAFGTKNISIEPGFYLGLMQPKKTSITYTTTEQQEIEDEFGFPIGTEPVEVTETGNATAWGLTVGMDLAFKYYLRFTDTMSAFIGGRGLAEAWLMTVNPENEELNSYDFDDRVGGLAQLDYFTFNASILAGVRIDSKTPFEIYAMVTPVGPCDSIMVTAGFNWHGAPIAWSAPHAKNTDVFMRW